MSWLVDVRQLIIQDRVGELSEGSNYIYPRSFIQLSPIEIHYCKLDLNEVNQSLKEGFFFLFFHSSQLR